MIWKFQPFSPTKELGKEYNAHCALVPCETDWVLILDQDVIILDQRSYSIMEKAIASHPETEIFSAYASRIGYSFQRLNEYGIDDNDSIRHHTRIAKEQADTWPNGECNSIQSAAGFFLLFRKSYWEKNPFQKNIYDGDGHYFDWNFCLPAMKKGKISLIRGIYCWHSYRLMQENIRDGTHLR